MELRQIEELIAPLLEQESVELVDLKFAKEGSGWVLRFFLDKPGGITIDDCAYMSERIGSLLDTSDVISHSYVLEVSSPGLDRVLKKEKDFERFSGKVARVRLKVPVKGQRNFKGRLLGLSNGKVLMEADGQAREFELSQIEEARLDYAADISW